MLRNVNKLVITTLLSTLVLTGCKSNTNNIKVEGNEKIKIVTSFYPMYLLTSEIVKDIENIELINLANPKTGCLHDYSLTTQEMKILEDSDILIINGAGMESFIDKAIGENEDLKVINASEGIELLTSKENSEHEHEHDEHEHDEHSEEINAHVWLNVENAIKQVENINSNLVEIDIENEKMYNQNTIDYIKELKELDNTIMNEVNKLSYKNIVTFHEAFPYFANRYGLNIVSVVQRETGSEPSAKELQETIESIKSLDVKAIFVEPQYSPKAANTISDETGINTYTLDPIVTKEQEDASYIDVMIKNLEVLKEALR